MNVDLADVQGLLRGYGLRYVCARHFFLGIADGASARAFVGALAAGTLGDGLQVTTAAERPPAERPASCLNIGITWNGLKALGVDDAVLAQFPPAFQQGPAVRAAPDPTKRNNVGLGDVGESAPARWSVGGPNAPDVHIIVSLYAQGEGRLKTVTEQLQAAFAAHLLTEHCHRDAQALRDDEDGPSRVHFGYRDGIAQPHIEGIPDNSGADLQPPVPTGDVLLGCEYENSFSGNYAGDLPHALVDNATYGAFRILYQDAAAFERLLDQWAEDADADREVIAAKVMGRWRNGTPLVLAPDLVDDEPPSVPEGDLNAFDYTPTPTHRAVYDDAEGLRCPIGAHARRLNPRGAPVMGVSHSRRLVRRNMPYGPPLENGTSDDGTDRGLIGYFLCGDLETQWEFIQASWVNQDLATHGIRGTREPIGGAQPNGSGTFTIPTSKSPGPIVLRGLPDLVVTRGSAYCLLPGIKGLKHLASNGGNE